MKRSTHRRSLRVLVLAALAYACAEAPKTLLTPETPGVHATTVTEPVLVLEPSDLTLEKGGMRSFAAFIGGKDADGNPDVGADGMAGTSDDQFVPANVNWFVVGGIGSVSPTTGTATMLTAGLPPDVTQTTGQVVAGFGPFTAAANVTVFEPLTELVFIDPDKNSTTQIPIFDPPTSTQGRILGLQFDLATLLGRLDLVTDPDAKAAIQRRIDAAMAELNALIPADARYHLAGMDGGAGAIQAKLQAFDPNGNRIAEQDLSLEPAGLDGLLSPPVVVIPLGGLIRGFLVGGILFIEGVEDGTIVGSAPGFVDAAARVVRWTQY